MRRAGLAALLVLLGACSTRPPVPLPPDDALAEARREALAPRVPWALSGRVSIDDGNDGGSGRIDWSVGPAGERIDFRGAMGRGAWRLTTGTGGAVLESAEGGVQRAASLEALVLDQVGWPVPIASLGWWVRGLAAPGRDGRVVHSADGLPERIDQDGWTVEYARYADVDGQAMPTRLEARSGERRVKLAVSDWRFGPDGEG